MVAAVGIISAIGSIASGALGFASAMYQQEVADMNASIAEDNARRAIERGQIAQQEQDDQTRALLGSQEASQGASGLSLNSPTAQRTRSTARMLGRKDALNVRQDAEIQAYNYKVEAANQSAAGKMAMLTGVGNLLTGFVQAGGSLVSNAAPTASYMYNRPVTKPSIFDPYKPSGGVY